MQMSQTETQQTIKKFLFCFILFYVTSTLSRVWQSKQNFSSKAWNLWFHIQLNFFTHSTFVQTDNVEILFMTATSIKQAKVWNILWLFCLRTYKEVNFSSLVELYFFLLFFMIPNNYFWYVINRKLRKLK